MNNYKDLEPKSVFRFFYEISQIPRPSGYEDGVTTYLQAFAAERDLWCEVDERGNTLIRKPAVKGREDAPSVCLQGHTDMVADKRGGVEHDFMKDPIQLIVEGEWLHAAGTTMGADNGIGVAMALAVLDSKDIAHGAIECLFTVDEEVSLSGATELKEGWLQSPYLINLDTEEEGEIVVGCAGGNCLTVEYDKMGEVSSESLYCARISVSGLAGGHSGVEIHKGNANGIKLLASMIYTIKSRVLEGVDMEEEDIVRLYEFNGGSKHNAIPIEATAVIAVPEKDKHCVVEVLNIMSAEFKHEFRKTDPAMEWKVETVSINKEAKYIDLTEPYMPNIIDNLVAVHDGVLAFDQESPTLVHSSSNLAIVTTSDNTIQVVTSQRSDSEFAKKQVAAAVLAAMNSFNRTGWTIDGDYPGWEPVYNSHLLQKAQEVHKRLTGHEAAVKTIHAGLECGLIGKKYPKMEMISIGPTLEGVHTPEERLHIPAMETAWQHLVGILSEI